jgi:Tol biopolymer transport system component
MKNIAIIFTFFALSASAQNEYLNQPLPTTASPIVFAPGILSSSYYERDITISPDGKEIYYSIQYSFTSSVIVYRELKNGLWSPLKKASFSGGFGDIEIEPSFSPDGNKLFFSSNRNISGSGLKDFDIWYVTRQGNGTWSSPQNVGAPINTTSNEYYPSITSDGSLYFTAKYATGFGGEDIWFSAPSGNGYSTPNPLPSPVNSAGNEFNGFISADGKSIYFSRDAGGGDLFISELNNLGTWTTKIYTSNSAALDYCPYITRNGNILFFTSERSISPPIVQSLFDVKNVIRFSLYPSESGGNIYWSLK